MGRVGIARTSWGELDRAEAAGPSWTELLRRAKVSYGEPERAGATQLKKGRARLTQSNREEGELRTRWQAPMREVAVRVKMSLPIRRDRSK